MSLRDIPGLGPRKIEELQARGVMTQDDLLEKSVYDNLPESARVYLKYKPIKQIPRASIVKLESFIKKHMKTLRPFVGGSYCRGKEYSGDIDILFLDKWSWDDILHAMRVFKPLPPYQVGPARLATLIKFGSKYAKVDMFKTIPEEYLFAKTYVIGSGNFNIILRTQAKRHGYVLNQKGLFKGKKRVTVSNEKELFQLCGVTYRPPSKR